MSSFFIISRNHCHHDKLSLCRVLLYVHDCWMVCSFASGSHLHIRGPPRHVQTEPMAGSFSWASQNRKLIVFFFLIFCQAAGVAASNALSFGPVICSSNGQLWKNPKYSQACFKVKVEAGRFSLRLFEGLSPL